MTNHPSHESSFEGAYIGKRFNPQNPEEPDEYASDVHSLLWSVRLKATPMRRALIELLEKESQPLSVAALSARLKMSASTVYRALEALVDAGIIYRIHTGQAHASYELVLGRKHHHHAICTDCGTMEDLKICAPADLNGTARKAAKKFGSIHTHSMEFFGLCKKCANK